MPYTVIANFEELLAAFWLAVKPFIYNGKQPRLVVFLPDNAGPTFALNFASLEDYRRHKQHR